MNEENQVETMAEEGSFSLSEELRTAIDADWNDDIIPTADADTGIDREDTAGKSADADQQDAEEPQNQDTVQKEEPKEAKAETDQFELKHLGETRTVSRDEVIAFAQKGMDYDRIRAKYDELRAGETERAAHEAFLKDLAESAGQSVEEMIDSARARILVNKAAAEGKTFSYDDAMAQVKQARAAAKQTETEEKPADQPTEADKEAGRQQSFMRFAQEYPEVKAEDIPKEVWEAFATGKGDLADLFARHENKLLKAQLAAVRQNEENRKKSTGSRASAGNSTRSRFDDLWYDGT